MMKLFPATRLALIFALVGTLGATACGKKADTTSRNPPPAAMPAALHVMGVTLGRTIGPDKRIINASQQFSPTETIYASVETMGSATAATLAARWTFEDGQLVDQSSQAIAPTGPAITEFHISKPSGWPSGKYKLEILLDGKSAGTKEFTIAS
ncbi:MAG: hypothetical protein SGI90_09305 [Candidatus Eisenbacteria bacterium]|nr:hypothetical protein [Candidatus Eisenbacteria bacterium]